VTVAVTLTLSLTNPTVSSSQETCDGEGPKWAPDPRMGMTQVEPTLSLTLTSTLTLTLALALARALDPNHNPNPDW